MNALTKVGYKAVGFVKAKSPELLLIAGVAGMVGCVVMACKATLKAQVVAEEYHEDHDMVVDVWKRVQAGGPNPSNYTKEDYNKDMVTVYVQTGVKYVKLYGPAVTLGILSILCIVGGQGILKKRNVALMAAIKTIEEGFMAYRKRVIEEFGEEKDYMFRNGIRAEKVTETVVGEDGKNKKVTTTVMKQDGMPSMYSRFFDESSEEWKRDSEYNKMFLLQVQNWFNNVLQTRGHVTLNEVYEALGLERSRAGFVVGWYLGQGCANYIDFGVFDRDNKGSRNFWNGNEASILLDFNVDGVIIDKVGSDIYVPHTPYIRNGKSD